MQPPLNVAIVLAFSLRTVVAVARVSELTTTNEKLKITLAEKDKTISSLESKVR